MDQLQRIHTLLKLNIFVWQLRLILDLAKLLLDHLLRPRRKGREIRAVSKDVSRQLLGN